MKKYTRFLLGAALALVLLVSLMALPAFADDDEPVPYGEEPVGAQSDHSHENWTPWGDAEAEKTSLPTESGMYYLTADIELPATWDVRVRDMHLCLNGHVVRLIADSGAVIELHDGAALYLYDCGANDRYFKTVSDGLWEDAGTEAPDGTVIAPEDYDSSTPGGTYVKTTGGVITGGKRSGVRFDDFYPCEFHIFGGSIVGNSNLIADDGYGGGVEVCYGGLFMKGGCIAGNRAKYGGGVGVHYNSSLYYWIIPAVECNVKGGCVTGNSATSNGGGLYGSSYTTIEIGGNGLINGNRAGSYGGGAYTYAELAMKNGTVKGNKAGTNGGGLYANAYGSIELSGGLVTGNSAKNGGGVYVNKTMSMSGGMVSGNSATSNGGGIRIANATDDEPDTRTLNITGGTVSDNSAKNGGGIYVGVKGSLTASDLTVTGNKATGYGGGIDIDTDGTVTLTGGSITNNTAGTNGGGVCFAGNGTTLGGELTVTDNTSGGKTSNLYIRADEAITLAEGDSALKGGAKIGISLQTPAENANSLRRFTANGTKDDTAYFFSDDTSRNYGPQFNTEGYLEIALLHLHRDANGNTVNFKEWTDSASLPNGGAWYLGTDVTLKRRDWEPTEDTLLCLNGHVISGTNGRCLWLEEASLDLYDEPNSATHYFKYSKSSEWTYLGDSASGSAVSLSDFSPETVSDGTVIAVPGGVITGRGMFIHVYSDLSEEPGAHFNMNGGSIVGINSDYAEPVNIQGDVTFTMYGGSIAGNFFPYGDIVMNHFGSVKLLGGIVIGNTASGAVVCCESGGTITVAGSTAVCNNTAEAGAVYAADGGVTVGGSAQITGNVTSGGTACNVRLNSGHKLALDAPAQGMSVGVSTANAPTAGAPVLFTGSAAEDTVACFFSDAGYTVSFRPTESSDSALYLTESSGLASVFGNGSTWLIIVLAAVVAAGSVCAVIFGKKKKVQ